MTVRTAVLGGTDWTDGEVLYAADQNDTITACQNKDYNAAKGILMTGEISTGSCTFSNMSNCTDEDFTTENTCGGWSSTATVTYKIDLGELKQILNLFIRFYINVTGPEGSESATTNIDCSTDNSSWTNVYTSSSYGKPSYGSGTYNVALDQEILNKYRYIRLTHTGNGTCTKKMTIYELAVKSLN
jgi:hypothetical protein